MTQTQVISNNICLVHHTFVMYAYNYLREVDIFVTVK